MDKLSIINYNIQSMEQYRKILNRRRSKMPKNCLLEDWFKINNEIRDLSKKIAKAYQLKIGVQRV